MRGDIMPDCPAIYENFRRHRPVLQPKPAAPVLQRKVSVLHEDLFNVARTDSPKPCPFQRQAHPTTGQAGSRLSTRRQSNSPILINLQAYDPGP